MQFSILVHMTFLIHTNASYIDFVVPVHYWFQEISFTVQISVLIVK